MRRWLTRYSAFVFVLMAFVLPVPAGLAAEALPGDRPVGTEVQQQQWLRGLALVGEGRFAQGAKLIHGLNSEGVSDERVQRIEQWLAEFETTQQSRRDRTTADYNRYVEWTLEDVEAGRWRQAALECTKAFNAAADEDAFRREPWLQKVVAGTLKAARAYEEEKEWYKAASIYVRLKQVFPSEKTYRESLEHCQDHLRLELTYEPDSEWEASIVHIVPDMARDAFRCIETYYLRKPVFKDAVVGGLKQVLRLTEQPKLEEVFEGLKNTDALQEFKSRVNVRLRYAEAKDSLTVDELIAYYDRVLEINEEVQLLPPEVLIHEFAYGALQPLDKFSDMIWPAEVMEFNKHTLGKFSGVGIQIRKLAGEPILVVSPLKDSPAYTAGIRPGDMITKINGKSASKYTITRAVREITGPEGTTVTLTIERPDDEMEFDVELERREIVITTVKGFERNEAGDWKFMIDPEHRIGFIRLTNFADASFEELKTAVAKLKSQGMRGLVFDLRDNPGGQLKSAVEVSELFLEPGKKIVSTLDRDQKPWEVLSSLESSFTDFPMVILVSPFSASASEIVTGALQVHHRSLVLGERTYGKGSVQQVLPLNHSQMAFLKLTTQLYYLPNGRCLHREDDSTTWGVDPDIEARIVPKERLKLYDMQLKTEILKGRNQESLSEQDIEKVTSYRSTTQASDDEQDRTPSGDDAVEGETADDEEDDEEDFVKRDDPNDYPEVDAQLEMALLLLRVRLESNQPWQQPPAEIVAKPVESTGG